MKNKMIKHSFIQKTFNNNNVACMNKFIIFEKNII